MALNPMLRRPRGGHWRGGVALALALALGGTAAAAVSSELRLQGLTFVSSAGDHNELVLRAERSVLPPSGERVELEGVHARLGSLAPGGASGGGLELRCARGVFDLESRNFSASGAVRGAISDGRRFETERLRYHASEGRVTGDARVFVVEPGGRFEGSSFEYLLREDDFQLRDARLLPHEPLQVGR